jgi:hypothetical protein
MIKIRTARRKLTLYRFRSLVKPVTLNHPLGTHYDAPREQSLQRSFVQAVAVDEISRLQDSPILRRGIDDLSYQ